VIAVACAGKFGGTAVAARATGAGPRESAAMGILMNTRGLMELVILSIGLELGVINETVFAMMVIMAIVTTFITTPLLHWVYPPRLFAPVPPAEREAPSGAFGVLIPVADPRSGGPLLRLADLLSGPGRDVAHRVIYALHLGRPVVRDAYRSGFSGATQPDAAQPAIDAGEDDSSLRPLLEHARAHGIPVEPISFATRDVAADIARVVRARGVRLVLMGFHKPVFSRTMLGGTVHRVMTSAEADVAVFVDRRFAGAQRVLVPYAGGKHDRLALQLAARLARHGDGAVTVLRVVGHSAGTADPAGPEDDLRSAFENSSHPVRFEMLVVQDASPVDAVLRAAPEFDLVVIGVSEEWGLASHLFGLRPERIAEACPTSLLIVRAHDAATLPENGSADGKADGERTRPDHGEVPVQRA
jgi:nucleotide-binding universal stress UspA family protein